MSCQLNGIEWPIEGTLQQCSRLSQMSIMLRNDSQSIKFRSFHWAHAGRFILVNLSTDKVLQRRA